MKPVYNANRDVEKAVSIGYDVFAQVEARRRAEVLLTELQEAFKARDELLSIPCLFDQSI